MRDFGKALALRDMLYYRASHIWTKVLTGIENVSHYFSSHQVKRIQMRRRNERESLLILAEGVQEVVLSIDVSTGHRLVASGLMRLGGMYMMNACIEDGECIGQPDQG